MSCSSLSLLFSSLLDDDDDDALLFFFFCEDSLFESREQRDALLSFFLNPSFVLRFRWFRFEEKKITLKGPEAKNSVKFDKSVSFFTKTKVEREEEET